MNPVNFEEYKDKIEIALIDKGFSLFNQQIAPKGEFILLDNFINQPIQKEISGSFIVGGPTLPMVALVSVKTGEVKYVALKAIIPDFPLN